MSRQEVDTIIAALELAAIRQVRAAYEAGILVGLQEAADALSATLERKKAAQ